MEKDSDVRQEERRIMYRDRRGAYHLYHRSARQGIPRIFRSENPDLSFLRARRRLRIPQYTVFLYPCGKDRTAVQEHARVYSRARIRYLFRLDAHRQRYGAFDLPAARIFRSVLDG